jgi:hypothetical protein
MPLITIEAPGMRPIRFWQDKLRDPSLTALLAAQIYVLFVGTPLMASGVRIAWAIAVVPILVLVAVVVLVSQSGVAMTTVLLALALSLSSAVMSVQHPTVLTTAFAAAGGVLAWLAVSAVVAAAVFGPGRVTLYRIRGAIVLYLALGSIFAEIYRLMLLAVPAAFAGIDPEKMDQVSSLATITYFSFTTMTSTGFGDIVPVHPCARGLANFQAVMGQLYPATVLARLITLELADRRS